MVFKKKKGADIYSKRFHICCTPKFYERIDRVSRALGIPKSIYVRASVEEILKRDEKYMAEKGFD